jgi:hypothetical protein
MDERVAHGITRTMTAMSAVITGFAACVYLEPELFRFYNLRIASRNSDTVIRNNFR